MFGVNHLRPPFTLFFTAISELRIPLPPGPSPNSQWLTSSSVPAMVVPVELVSDRRRAISQGRVFFC
jgi:hypothetical protein